MYKYYAKEFMPDLGLYPMGAENVKGFKRTYCEDAGTWAVGSMEFYEPLSRLEECEYGLVPAAPLWTALRVTCMRESPGNTIRAQILSTGKVRSFTRPGRKEFCDYDSDTWLIYAKDYQEAVCLSGRVNAACILGVTVERGVPDKSSPTGFLNKVYIGSLLVCGIPESYWMFSQAAETDSGETLTVRNRIGTHSEARYVMELLTTDLEKFQNAVDSAIYAQRALISKDNM